MESVLNSTNLEHVHFAFEKRKYRKRFRIVLQRILSFMAQIQSVTLAFGEFCKHIRKVNILSEK